MIFEEILNVIEELGLESEKVAVTQFEVRLESGLTMKVDRVYFGDWFVSLKCDTGKMLDVGMPIQQVLYWPIRPDVGDRFECMCNDIAFNSAIQTAWLPLVDTLLYLERVLHD